MARNEDYSDDDQDYQDEPNFDDPEGFVDDVDDDGKNASMADTGHHTT